MVKPNNSHEGLLRSTKSYSAQFIPFFLPYACYVGMDLLSGTALGPTTIQLLKLLAVSGCLICFRKYYTFGVFRARDVWYSALHAPFLCCLWVYPLKLCLDAGFGSPPSTGLADIEAANLYSALRIVNSVVLVAIFEELFCRAYVLSYFYEAGTKTGKLSFVDRIMAPLDHAPAKLSTLPLSRFSIIAATAIFALGHSPPEYISAVLYFAMTTWLYWKTQSFWVCILTHAFTNLLVALLVHFNNMAFLWF